MSRADAFYLDVAPDASVFALLDRPAEAPASATGVLLCSPWGWDEIASYRSRRDWAERLAAAGHPCLRFDFPAAGDSTGVAATTDLVALWVEAIRAGVAYLRSEVGTSRVALLGIGLGALLAEEALARGVLAEDLICWGAPPSGRHFVRETKAFAAMQADRPVERDGEEDPLPTGWLEAGGFVLSAETLSALKSLRPDGAPGSRRALLIGRDGIEDSAGRERLEAAGVAVAEDPGDGWGRFVEHPETTELSPSVAPAVDAWLADEPDGAGAPADGAPNASASATFAAGAAGGLAFTEEPIRIEESFGDAFGILARPDTSEDTPLCTVFLNAGAIRHVGPNRIWTEAARELAAGGIPSLRVDLESIGEADGDPARRAHVSDFYAEEFVGQTVAVLDRLERLGVGSRFRLVGLCGGAYWAFRTALIDERVDAAVLINAGALVWHPGILGEREGRRAGRVLRPEWWGKLLRGQIRWSKLPRLAGQLLVGALRSVRRRLGPTAASGGSAIAADLDRLPPERRIVLAFSGNEPLHEELASHGVLDRVGDWPGVEVVDLPGSDHTLRAAVAQRAVADLLRRELGAGEPQPVDSTGRQK